MIGKVVRAVVFSIALMIIIGFTLVSAGFAILSTLMAYLAPIGVGVVLVLVLFTMLKTLSRW